MYVIRSDQQVTRIILTPSVRYEPMRAEKAASALETPGDPNPIWIIKRGAGATT